MTDIDGPGEFSETPLPAPRSGRPAWVWLLGCLGTGTAVFLVIAVVLGVLGYRFVRQAFEEVGPISAERVHELMADVPGYPGGVLDLSAVRAALTSMRIIEKTSQRTPGSVVLGVAIYRTADSPEQALVRYQQLMNARKWKSASFALGVGAGGSPQAAFFSRQSASVQVIVSTDTRRSPSTLVSIFRGAPALRSALKSISDVPVAPTFPDVSVPQR